MNPSQFALLSAVEWLRSVLLGTVATMIAVLAIAAIGLLMLSGRLPARRAGSAVIGCFIVFSAAAIASGIIGATSRPVAVAEFSPRPAYAPSTPRPMSGDPYAGASVPDQRTKDVFP